MNDAHRQWLGHVAQGIGDDLLRFLRARMANPADAEELAQEVYLRLLRMRDPRRIRNRRAYVLRVAANVAYEWNLLARNRLHHSSGDLEMLRDGRDVVRDVVVLEETQLLQRALQRLSPRCRAVLLMKRRDGLTQREIAEQMGISVSMVKKFLARGLSVCQQYFAEHYDDGSGND